MRAFIELPTAGNTPKETIAQLRTLGPFACGESATLWTTHAVLLERDDAAPTAYQKKRCRASSKLNSDATHATSKLIDAAPVSHEQALVEKSSTAADPREERPPVSWNEAVSIWDDIPGMGRRVAKQLVAEVGTDMSRFPNAAHLASWAKRSLGNRESAGKRSSSSIGYGNQWLRGTLIQAAHAAVKVRGSYLSAFYRRLVARRGLKKAIVAVAHTLLTIAYTRLCKRERYKDPGSNYLDERRKDRLLNQMRNRIERLGYSVVLEPRAAAT